MKINLDENKVDTPLSFFSEWNPNPIIELNMDGKVIYLNLAARTRFSMVATQGIAHPILDGLMEKITLLIKENKNFIVFNREITLLKNIYDEQVFVIPNQNSIFIYIIDITAKKNAENELQKLNKGLEGRVMQRTSELAKAKKEAEELASKAEAANYAKGAFLTVMSHEIRTPLNGIIGMNSLLLESNLTNDQRHMAEVIQSSSETLLILINQILDFSQIDSGKIELEKTEFNLKEVVEKAVDLMLPLIYRKNLTVELNYDKKIPHYLIGDYFRITQVLHNLLGNAVKFTEKGGITLNVKFHSKMNEKIVSILFEVVDTGIGISEEVIQNLFKPFMQGDTSTTRKYGGTGLGLAICKKLIENMGGDIGVNSTLAKGSNFYFCIPIYTSPKKIP